MMCEHSVLKPAHAHEQPTKSGGLKPSARVKQQVEAASQLPIQEIIA